jgi:glycerol-3-phosphate acyltransferase PlsY
LGDRAVFDLIIAGLAGYLIGSIPMGVLLARVFGWPDPRGHGSGHTGGLNVARGAGTAAGVAVGVADLLKGLAAVLLAGALFENPWAVTGCGIAAVAGHNWPVWLRFRGGMGLAAAAGAMLTRSWLTLVIAIAVAALLRFVVIKHSPRATIAAMIAVPLILLLLRVDAPTFWLGAGMALLVALRYSTNWNRRYNSTSEL